MDTAVDVVDRIEAYSLRLREVVLLVKLDVRNAFNSVIWLDMLAKLENYFHVPDYFFRIFSCGTSRG